MENVNPYTDKLSYWSSHQQIVRILANLPMGSRILDIGAGLGTLARLSDGKGFVLRGIEPNFTWLGDTRILYSEVYEGTLEQTPDSYLEGHDAVVCADVLEHLVYPEEQLKRLVKKQSDQCIYLISVPNVANIWIRLNLLFGHFDYQDRGILDRTHLHFYTKNSFIALLLKAGLHVTKLIATPIPMDLMLPFLSNNTFGNGVMKILNVTTQISPGLLGYQWIAIAYKALLSNNYE